MTLLKFSRDIQGFNALGPAISANLFSGSLQAGSDASFTIPASSTGFMEVFFGYPTGGEVWVAVNGSAQAPVTNSNSISSTSSVANVSQLKIISGTTVNLLNNSSETQNITIACYEVAA